MSPLHVRTRVLVSATQQAQILFVGDGDIFFQKLLIIVNDSLIKTINFSTVTIKKVEINEAGRQLKITSNPTWTRTGPCSDNTTIYYY
jgi:hypothetical protein